MTLFSRYKPYCACQSWFLLGEGMLVAHLPLFILRSRTAWERKQRRTGWYVPFIAFYFQTRSNSIRLTMDWGLAYHSKHEFQAEWS